MKATVEGDEHFSKGHMLPITAWAKEWTCGRGKRQLRSSSKSCPGGAPVTDRDMRVFSARGSALPTSLLPVWQVREATWQNKAKPDKKPLNYIFPVHVHWLERQPDIQMGPRTQTGYKGVLPSPFSSVELTGSHRVHWHLNQTFLYLLQR